MDLQLKQFLCFLSWDMVFHVCPLAENHPALHSAYLLLKFYRCMAVKWALLYIFPLGGKMKTCWVVPNLLSGMMMMLCPAPVKMTAILRTWIRISMMTVLRTVTLTDQMQRVTGMSSGTVRTVSATTLRRRSQV